MLHIDDTDDVRTVTLDRPERRNALTPDTLDALEAAVVDPPTPVVHLHGAGSAFCAGADLDAVSDVAAATEAGETDAACEFAAHGQRVARAVADSAAVVVAGVDGAARGGGVELALACDLRVATPEATFAETGVTFGLFGAWGGTARLPRVVGEGNAMDIALSGRTVDAEEALRMGLVSRIVDDPATVAAELAVADHTALGRLKPLVRATRSDEDRERAERDAFADLVARNADALQRD
ncbi:enoyl-CoA hydratase-related protein [Halomarina oriensis]|uniref:Enoyl-CoA hydratase/isomerase family protein n=1 Tax=Halomarina oriensis TaxID=671145 RepID=A0A6B0GRD2_9EURY|nr:enoyl-CoA hydratase/isomerase family protein [Halomarina oriensis]